MIHPSQLFRLYGCPSLPGPVAISVLVAALPLSALCEAWADEIPPYPYGASSWMTAIREKLKAPVSVKQLAELLKPNGIAVLVAPSPTAYQRRRVPESVARKRDLPPGLPDVDWSIYLLPR